MLKILPAFYNQNLHLSNPVLLNNTVPVCTINNYHKICSGKKSIISFSGINSLFISKKQNLPDIKIINNVSDNFVSNATQYINDFSSKWLKKFRDEHYKIIFSPSFSKAYESQNVFDPTVEFSEIKNPLGTLGITYTDNIGRYGRNFFVFCDKPPLSNQYMKNIINHELSHGVINITKLDKNQNVYKLIISDIKTALKERKLENLTKDEQSLVSYYFFSKNANLPFDEILADLYAWNKGSGIYGSKLISGIDNPNLMKYIFPKLSEYLKNI